MNEENIKKILDELESGYDRMAEKFSETRAHFWRDLGFISDYIEDGDKIMDFGCGNGRLLEILNDKKVEYVGIDVSQKLIDLAKSRFPERKFVKVSSQHMLPFSDNFFNKIISIAVFHHFPEEHAEKTAKELYRITKPDGTVIITVWNLWQSKFKKYILDPGMLYKKILGKTELGFKDIYIPFKNNKGETFSRFHRAYTKKDLIKIFQRAGFERFKVKLVNNKNILIEAKK